MRSKLVLSIGISGLAFYGLAAPPDPAANEPPEVTITAPAENAVFQWNSVVPFVIGVSDREDGKSEFEEIAPNEVLLRTVYLPDPSQKDRVLSNLAETDTQALRRMSASNCLTCHTAKTKLIGPSFDLIAGKYPDNPETVASLAKKIIAGSNGIWGNVQMPPHPDLKIEQATEMVAWILRNSSDPNQSFVVGIEGAFKTREKPDNDAGIGIYLLMASYMDRGLKDLPQSAKQGHHTIALKPAR